MRIVSLLVAICFSFNVMASTGTIQQLESSLNDYQYSLSVEWDQKDQAFYDAKTAEFFAKLDKLIKEDGLTKEEILAFAALKLNNKPLVDAIKLKMSLFKNTSAEDLASMISESSKDMYAKGASWNGEIIFPAIGVLIAVAIVGYSYWWDAHHECVATDTVYMCNTYNSCTGMSTMGTYSPYWTGIPNNSPNCINFPQTYCGYQTVCTEYVEK
jgi:hypothetical protein